MTDFPAPTTAPPVEPPSDPVLRDAWSWSGPIPVTGWLERNGFHPLWTALLVFVLAFALFQGVSLVVIGVGVALDAVSSGQTEPPDAAVLMESLMENGSLLMTANTIGQVLGFAVFALLVAKLHSPAVREYLRIRRPDLPGVGLAVVGWMVLYPAVLWTGQLNERIPLPEKLRLLEQSQIDMIEGLLLGDGLSTGFLFVALALTPALCEEIMFRGYLQRQVERGWGTVASILVVGVAFGFYHLRLSQAIPLSLLGVYLGFVVWATGSVWTGTVVHLLNNGLAVLVAGYARQDPTLDLDAIEATQVPWYLGLAGLVLAAGVAYALYQRRLAVVGDRPDAVLDTPDPLLSPVSPSPALP